MKFEKSDLGYWLLMKGKDYQTILNEKVYKELLDMKKSDASQKVYGDETMQIQNYKN